MDTITVKVTASSNTQGDKKELEASSTLYFESSLKPSCEALVL